MSLADLGLHGLIGSKGGIVKSIQSGRQFISGVTQLDVAIEPVNQDNSIIMALPWTASTNSDIAPNAFAVRAEFNGNNIRFIRANSAVNVYVTWYIIEFVSVKRKQSGQTTGTNVTISPVDLSKSFAFSSFSTTTTVKQGGRYANAASFLSETLLGLDGSAAQKTVNWQVIEFN